MLAPSHGSLALEELSRLTGLPIPPPISEVVEPAPLGVDPNGQATKSAMRVKLLGTLLATAREWSIALVLDASTNDPGTYMVGDRLQDAYVLQIERRRVIILNKGRREFIDDQPPTALGAPGVASRTNTTAGASGGPGIRAISESEYEVSRAEIDRTLRDLYPIALEGRIMPAFKNGVAYGLKLFAIRPDSFYTRIGIQNGDVITRINGFDLNSMEKALEIYARLKDSNRIDAELERNGTVLRKSYNIR